jgi:hypothetical protein
MKTFGKTLAGIACGLTVGSTAHALPMLQLDIQGGTYVGGSDETTYANSSTFTLYALLNSLTPGGSYAISAAIVPHTSIPLTEPFGSFSIGGQTFSAANMSYGTPPFDSGFDDIPGHGIYATHYAEITFNFTAIDLYRMNAYNVQDDASVDPESQRDANGSMLYQSFFVDASGLAPGYAIHFDLYDPDNMNTTFAPFSHDAQSGGTPVPDGGMTVSLLGIALLGLGGLRRKFSRSA